MSRFSNIQHAVFAAALLASTASAQSPQPEEAIADAYRAADHAYAESDPQGMTRFIGASVRVTGQDGQARLLTHAQAVAAARYAVRPITGSRAVRQSRTGLESFRREGDRIVVRGTTVESIDALSEFAITHVQDTIGFEDEWRLSGGRWNLEATRRTSFQRTGGGQPSPSAMTALRNMRQSNDMLRNFNKANNYSFCMNEDRNQGYDYETRKKYCGG
jgi:hypothetical protein